MQNIFQKGSTGFWLIIVTLALTFLLFVPLPYYHHLQGWFMGPSIAARFIDNTTEAAPIDRIATAYINANLKSPFDINCTTDLDCNVITIVNQCRSYCADSSNTNPEVIKQLENNRVCDPALWSPEYVNCRCIFNKCLIIEY